MWLDGLHHALHVALTGERDGYYARLRRLDGAASPPSSAGPRAPRIVACAQNHDQVGNRALGDRLPDAKRRVAAAVVLFSPFTPLLFQGEEYGETAPFQFFTDHIDPFIADATREGRRREFARFAGFARRAARPAGRGDVRALEADARASRRSCTRGCCGCGASCRASSRSTVDESARTLELRRGRATLCVPTSRNETVELEA